MLGVVELPPDLTSLKAARIVSTTASRFLDEVGLHAAADALLDDLQDASEQVIRLKRKIQAAERQLRALSADPSNAR